jgi:hypothetical protein
LGLLLAVESALDGVEEEGGEDEGEEVEGEDERCVLCDDDR